jgi:hypothetical protein
MFIVSNNIDYLSQTKYSHFLILPPFSIIKNKYFSYNWITNEFGQLYTSDSLVI